MLQGYKSEAEEKLVQSKEKLRQACVTKIKTTMIGALAAFEQMFEIELDDPQFASQYDELRKKILDNGNELIRVLDKELKNYNVEWKGNFYQFKREG